MPMFVADKRNLSVYADFRKYDKSSKSKDGLVRYRILNKIRVAISLLVSSWTIRRPETLRYNVKFVTVYAVYVSA
jgi:hypothetical protein